MAFLGQFLLLSSQFYLIISLKVNEVIFVCFLVGSIWKKLKLVKKMIFSQDCSGRGKIEKGRSSEREQFMLEHWYTL